MTSRRRKLGSWKMKTNEKQYFDLLNRQIDKILSSKARKKLIVAGPGTGKTSFFKKAIRHYGGGRNEYLALTFINNLVDELQHDLGELTKVYTFHGYCHFLLRKYSNLRLGLQDNFEYYPPLIKLIKSDWEIIKQDEPPQFSGLMRNVNNDDSLKFFLNRGNYYNAIGYDDSVYRVFKALSDNKYAIDKYKLIIVDECQDFNQLETSVLSFISRYNPILIVGDDDQTLYSQLRNSDPDFIRKLFNDGEYISFELPFCLRCPNAVIEVFKKFVESAKKNNLLEKRINKRFDFFPPIKGRDSKKYPRIKLVLSSIQKKTPIGANYFGRYIVQEIKKIPKEEIRQSYDKNYPTVLIIGPTYYLNSILPAIKAEKYDFDFKKNKADLKINLEKGFVFIKKCKDHNLGWRIIVELEKLSNYQEIIKQSAISGKGLFELLPTSYTQKYIKKASAYEIKPIGEKVEPQLNLESPKIKLVTYEGAKGLSAQHVFILGVQNGDLPRNSSKIKDLEVCKFLVALTRTRKQCQILCTTNFAGKSVNPSVFIKWLPKDQIKPIKINKNYWKN